MAVTEDDYEAAVACLRGKLPEDLIIMDSSLDPNYCASWIKVADKNTRYQSSLYSANNSLLYNGVHVDIYKLSRTSRKNYPGYLLSENIRYFNKRFERHLIDAETLMQNLQTVYEKYQQNTVAAASLPDNPTYAFLNFLQFERDFLFPTKEYCFEGLVFQGPADADGVLRNSYYGAGYMTPPEYENRDLKIDYIEFLN